MAPRDVVVVGLGVTGSASLAHLARRSPRALGIEQFSPGHDRGSSHGATRIIRLGYFEHPSYVPLVREAYSLWRDLERQTGQRLLQVTGILEIGAPDGELVAGTLAAARLHALVHEVLDSRAVKRRFPAFDMPSGFVGVFQPDGGVLAAEPANLAHLKIARQAGAEVRTDERVRAIEPTATGVRIATDRETIEAPQAIVAAGSWLATLLAGLPVALRVTRQALGWFAPLQPALFAPERFCVFMIESAGGIFYGFPPHAGASIKFAKHHHQDEPIDPTAPTRPFSADDAAILRAALRTQLPAANGPLVDAKVCRYTMAPDGDFILDRVSGAPQIIVASPCSGHGFKFAPVIGEILADLVACDAARHLAFPPSPICPGMTDHMAVGKRTRQCQASPSGCGRSKTGRRWSG
jgi:sarcosine oxidase